ncbi:hypothetical protein [Desulforamulus reducens]|nr:hypothetical protein [Desulforamulus reducens]
MNDAYEGTSIARVPFQGGVLFQDVPVNLDTGYCYLLNFGIRGKL